MNFRELYEDSKIDNFADDVKDVFKDVSGLARSAFGKFKDAKHQAQVDQKKAQTKVAKADKQLDKGKKSKDEQPSKPDATIDLKAGPRTSEISIANIVVNRRPSAQNTHEFDDVGASNFGNLVNAVPTLQKRLDATNIELSKKLRNASYIDDYDRDKVTDGLSDQTDKPFIRASEQFLYQNKEGIADAWKDALLLDDPKRAATRMINALGNIVIAHKKKNQQAVGSQKKIYYAEGLKLINMLAAQRQVLQFNLEQMAKTLDELSQKPVSEALLKRVGKLSKKLT